MHNVRQKIVLRHCVWKLSTNECSKSQLQEEADTGIVFRAIDVTKRDSFSELVVMCSDTDVFLHILHYFEMISSSTILRQTSMNTPYARRMKI